MNSRLFNYLFLFCILLLGTLTHAKTDQQLIFTNQDLKTIKQELETQKILLGVGPFFEINNLASDGASKEEIQSIIKQKGFINVLFGSQKQYDLFITYLTEITDINNNFIDQTRQRLFKVAKKEYIFNLNTDANSLGISISIKNKGIDIEGLDYSECTYMYDFKKINNDFMLDAMNIAGGC